jgi:site-specific DNA-methyltransferase (adenine-specific)
VIDSVTGHGVVNADMLEVAIKHPADHVFGDPPYADDTQRNTRSGKQTATGISRAMDLDFAPATPGARRQWAHWMARNSRRWVGVFSDHESSMDWRDALVAAGLVYHRCVLWIRTGDVELTANRPRHSGAPQFTGTKPAAGHECIVLAHHPGATRWNGGGHAAIYTSPVVPPAERLHKAQKPLSLMRDILEDFTRPGESVIDPFAGVGTTVIAAKSIGRPALGIEISAQYADLARRRVAASAIGG